MRYETGNPVGPDGSSSSFDLHDNAGVIDLLVNGPLSEYLSRLGIPLKSWRGIMDQVTDYLIAQGYESVYLAYGAGVIVERQTQLVQRSGELYRVMNAADIPLTLTGTWATDAPKLQAVGDAALRQILAGPTGTTLIGRGDQTLEESLAGIEGDILGSRSGLQSALAQMHSQIGNLTRFSVAAASGTVRVGIVGDSILQGVSQIDYRDSPAGLMMRVLEEQNPGIAFVFGNFSIPGQGLYQFRSPAYVGGSVNVPDTTFAMEESSNAERRWPGGTTAGKTWYNHVRDFAPDILIFGFGMNHVNAGSGMYSPTTVTNATFWRDVDSMISSWTVKPSVALIPSMLPTHDSVVDGGVWPRFRIQVQQDADMQRAMCREKNWTCVDANRVWNIATDARDPVLMRHNHFLGLASYADKFNVTAGSWSITGGDSLQGYGTLRSKDMCTDLYQKIRYTVSDVSASAPGMFWRDRGDVVGGQQNAYFLLVVRSSGNDLLNFYWQGQTIKSQVIGAAKNTYDIEVLCQGGRHRIWVDKALMADESHMGNMGQGYNGVSIGGTTAGTLSLSEFRQGTPSVVGLPQYNDVDMLGLGQDEWAANPDSLGGGKINHPSKLGVAVAYLPAFEPLASAMRSIIARSAGPICINGKDETVDFWTGLNYATLVVDDVVQQRVYPVVTGDYVSLNSTIYHALNLESTKVVIVYIWHNENSQHLPTSMTLARGRWVIQATMGLSKSSPTRHVETLNLVAHKV